MGAFNKRMKQLRSGSTGNRILDALQLVIPAVMLTADDIWCVTNEQTQQLVKGSFEIIEGYKDEGGLKALHKEFAERGIQIELHNGFSTPPYKIPERGRGVWQTIEVEEKKDKEKKKQITVCSRCGKGNAIKTPYCGWCGADMRPKEDKDA
jgi:hypothetical protein